MHRRGDYTPVSDMSEGQTPADWRNFYVDVAGNTNGAHQSYVNKLKRAGHTQVSSLDQCDYCVVFCPVASRVGTDVNEALDRDAAAVGKPVILVVMHHTFSPNHVVAESKRLVNKANVHQTVDCLFYEGRLLDSDTNDFAWYNIQKSLGLPQGLSPVSKVCQWMGRNKWWIIIATVVGIAVIAGIVTVAVKRNE